ncbi:sigma-54 interaction domain-containing protein [Alteribacillus sp. HJP-4]|uniref:sigma-54 interaction domain-containing protein n=1 Tax=Alteribacillus sp. HJP-4 TaxID=2775394 RepID=UPI0035CD1005
MNSHPIFENKTMKEILNVLHDGLYFSDCRGNTIWLNDASEKILGASRKQLIGNNVWDLEEAGIMKPSITRMVIEGGESVSGVQTSLGDREYLVTGHILDLDGDSIIVVHSRDITKDVEKSLQLEETENLLRRFSQEIRHIQVEKNEVEGKGFLGKGPKFRKLLRLISKVAGVQTTVLITGETGTGKNAVAERIHDLSDRHQGPLIQINCGSIPASLVESELFGYKKGAFTGAYTGGKTGLVKLADKGTLFLDEIGELPLHVQPKLLQLLQDKTFLPVGGTSLEKADIRIIAATNKDLKKMAGEGTFREDLYYRLNVLPIHVLPLRERREDIFPILQVNLEHFNQLHQKNRSFTRGLYEELQAYHWPGNIRELENVVERLVVTADKEKVDLQDLPDNMRQLRTDNSLEMIEEGESLPDTLNRIEKSKVIEAYRKHGSTRKAAKMLGITQSALMRRLKKYEKV